MEKKIYNFYPGPAVLPRPVLEKVQEELLDFGGTGLSIWRLATGQKLMMGSTWKAERG